MTIEPAGVEDIPALLELQRLAYRSEAELLNDPAIPPLRETREDIGRQMANGSMVYKLISDKGEIIGSVRSRTDGSTLFIGKLMVHPSCQRRGYGKELLAHVERSAPSTVTRFELFTSNLSEHNLQLYTAQGYIPFREEPSPSSSWQFVFLEKYN